MLYLTIASLIVALIAAGYAVKQTSIAKAMQDKQDDEQKEVRDWQARPEAVAKQLCKINPLFQAQYPDGIVRVIYADLFPANPVRIAIETTIIRRPDRQYFHPANSNSSRTAECIFEGNYKNSGGKTRSFP